ncbi:MAG: RHS repeat-associated core domain-containing protein [Dysgonomonas sp.]
MKTLQRYGRLQDMSIGLVDNLTTTYTGNQLTKVEDAVPTISRAESMDFKNYSNAAIEYTYNANGAMTKDLNKGITGIKYNFLNLPQAIEVASPSVKGRVKYTYSAGGVKLKTVHETDMNVQTATIMAVAPFASETTNTLTTDYVGNKVYENGIIRRILVDGGYIQGNEYHFYQTDHLGNNRVVAKAGGTQVQKTHYYPFGSSFGVATGSSTQPYRYNGKELDQMHGLNLYDYSARYYEAAIGRFTTVDPLAEKYYSWSPYAYCMNNPLKYIDPTGMWIIVSDGNNSYRYDNGQLYREQMNFQTRSMEYVAYTPDAGSFTEGILNGLNDLVANSTGVGQSLVDYFSNDQNNIGISTNAEADKYGNHIALGEQGYATIYMKSDLSGSNMPTQAGMQQSPFWLDLGHEIAHGHDRAIRGDAAATATRDGLVTSSGEILQRTEVYATFRENQMRGEAGLPLRTHYYTNKAGTRGMGPSLINSSGQSTFLGTPYLPANTLPPPRPRIP